MFWFINEFLCCHHISPYADGMKGDFDIPRNLGLNTLVI